MHNFAHSLCIYVCFVCCACFHFALVCKCVSLLLCFLLLVQMSSAPYVGFADGACRSTCNLSSAAWVIYDPHGELLDLQGVCLGRTTNNVAEYSAVIELLAEAVDLGIRELVVNLVLQGKVSDSDDPIPTLKVTVFSNN